MAVDPPVWVSERLAGWARIAAHESAPNSRNRPLRLLQAQMIHITLCFLGDRPLSEVETIKSALARCAGDAPSLSVGMPLWLPPRHPRALAVEVNDHHQRLDSLQRDIQHALVEAIGLEPERRRFRAHMTVARLSGRAAVIHQQLLTATPALRFAAESLTLYRSWLSRSGASYEPLLELTLG